MENWINHMEEIYQIDILYACESGSRAWNSASSDSDYDIRFIYKQKGIRCYLSIDSPPNVLDFAEPYDAHGWDLFKTLQLLQRSNPSLFEWAFSPIVYRDHNFKKQLQYFIVQSYSTQILFMHYLHVMEGNIRTIVKTNGASLKLQKSGIQALRAFFIARDLYQTNQLNPQLLFSTFEQLDDKASNEYQRLLAAKKRNEVVSMDMEVVKWLQGERESMLHSAKLTKRTTQTVNLNGWLWEILGI
jgi:predicted nucleotidyltransferase